MPTHDESAIGFIREHIEDQNGLLQEMRGDVKTVHEDMKGLHEKLSGVAMDVAVLKSLPHLCSRETRITALESQITFWKGGMAGISAIFGLLGAGIVLGLNWFFRR